MDLDIHKLSTYESNIKDLSDTPSDDGVTGDMLKAMFDGRTDNEVKEKHNALIDAIKALGGEDMLVSGDTDILKYMRVNDDGAIEISRDGQQWRATASSGHVIVDKEGREAVQRSRLRFARCNITDDGEATVVNAFAGERGPQGERGETGAQGPKGETGDIGPVIVPTVSSDGIISFKVQRTAIAPASANIRGPQGPQGYQGPQGIPGAQGAQGLQGVQGYAGPRGEQGPQGATGPAGAPGLRGEPGAKGERGEKGEDGRSFQLLGQYESIVELTEAHPAGNIGDAYAVRTTDGNTVYLWDIDAGAWVDIGALQGPQGVQGIQGERGSKGDTGDSGPPGPEGIQGPQGAQGPQGVQGTPGSDGAPGAPGMPGKTAYQSAVSGGYGGTEAEFYRDLNLIGGKAPEDHASEDATYGAGSDSMLGHVKVTPANGLAISGGNITLSPASISAAGGVQLEDSVQSEAVDRAATANAVKTAYDMAVAAQAAAEEGSKTFTVTLSTSWSGTSAPYSQTTPVSGILSEDNPIVDVVLSAAPSIAELQEEAWGCVSRIITNEGSITAFCNEAKPVTAIPIQLKVVR